jgi:CRISPR-associated protein Cmr1
LDIRPADTQALLSPLNRSNLEQWDVCRPLADCLKLEWPHAIGTAKNGPLVWRTKIQSADWRPIIKELARIKIEFRTQFGFSSGGPHSSPTKRHMLAYPVTNHALNGWGQQARLGNQLRFKVAIHENGKLEGVIVHLPSKVPEDLVSKLSQTDQQFIRNNELSLWESVHRVLDREAARL